MYDSKNFRTPAWIGYLRMHLVDERSSVFKRRWSGSSEKGETLWRIPMVVTLVHLDLFHMLISFIRASLDSQCSFLFCNLISIQYPWQQHVEVSFEEVGGRYVHFCTRISESRKCRRRVLTSSVPRAPRTTLSSPGAPTCVFTASKSSTRPACRTMPISSTSQAVSPSHQVYLFVTHWT